MCAHQSHHRPFVDLWLNLSRRLWGGLSFPLVWWQPGQLPTQCVWEPLRRLQLKNDDAVMLLLDAFIDEGGSVPTLHNGNTKESFTHTLTHSCNAVTGTSKTSFHQHQQPLWPPSNIFLYAFDNLIQEWTPDFNSLFMCVTLHRCITCERLWILRRGELSKSNPFIVNRSIEFHLITTTWGVSGYLWHQTHNVYVMFLLVISPYRCFLIFSNWILLLQHIFQPCCCCFQWTKNHTDKYSKIFVSSAIRDCHVSFP